MSPKELLAELEKFSMQISETRDRLLVPGVFNASTFAHWHDIAQKIGIFGASLRLTTDTDETIDASFFTDSKTVNGRIVIDKIPATESVHFFTAQALAAFLETGVIGNVRRAYTAAQNSTFASEAMEFYPWRDAAMFPAAADKIPEVDPRREVRDLTSRKVVPSSIAPWVVKTWPDVRDAVWIDWSGRAGRAIALSLSTEVKDDENGANGIVLVFKSGRIVTVNLDAADPANYLHEYAVVSDLLARWVFIDGYDVTTRHILMSSALAQEWLAGIDWTKGIPQFGRRALESAQSGYALNLSDTAREALKALTDLRKSLYDEVPKSLQLTKDLASGLWRDLAIALAALLARVALPNQTTATTIAIYTIGLYVVAGYVLLSGTTNIVINWRFRRIERSSRNEWLKRMYSNLGKAERDSLAETPYRQADKAYNSAAFIIGGVYVAMFGALLLVPYALHLPTKTTHRATSSSSSVPVSFPKPSPHRTHIAGPVHH